MSSSSSLSLFTSTFVITLLLAFITTIVTADEGLVIRSYSTADCSGSFKTVKYSPNECKPSSGTSAKFECNSTIATLTSYTGSSDCTGAASENNYNIGQCYSTSASYSTMYQCSAGQVGIFAVVAVLMMLSVLMM